jgi:multidrug efflux pump subunit AcrA (membrane-fusion protein)
MIASRILAPVAAVHVRPGDRVRQGAPLVTLDAREIRAATAQASASLASAVDAVRAAESDSRAAESGLRLARASHDRIKTLHDKRSATPQELDQAVAALDAAEAQLAGARARAAAATSARDAAQASLHASEIGVSYTVLSAPFDGVVTERRVDPGSMAVPGAPLLMLDDPTAFRLEVQADEARAARIRTGQTADVRLDSGPPGEWTTGTVVEVARIDPASHSFLVKVDVPVDSHMRSGLFGRARFTGPSRRALTIPSSAVVRRGQLTFVFAVDADGLARLRPIMTGSMAAERVEALAGVQAGDRVVLNPPPALSDGARITPNEHTASVEGPGDRR